MSMIKNAKSATQTKVLEEFMNMVLTKCDRACYDTESVEYAHESMAIETFLITEECWKIRILKLEKSIWGWKKSVNEAREKSHTI